MRYAPRRCGRGSHTGTQESRVGGRHRSRGQKLTSCQHPGRWPWSRTARREDSARDTLRTLAFEAGPDSDSMVHSRPQGHTQLGLRQSHWVIRARMDRSGGKGRGLPQTQEEPPQLSGSSSPLRWTGIRKGALGVSALIDQATPLEALLEAVRRSLSVQCPNLTPEWHHVFPDPQSTLYPRSLPWTLATYHRRRGLSCP